MEIATTASAPKLSLQALKRLQTRLHDHPLFNVRVESMNTEERVALSYQRAKMILTTYKLTASDIVNCTNKYWAMQLDPVMPLDLACFTILAAHVGLATGTLTCYLKQRPDLQPLVDSLLRFDTVGVYLLSERGHGLDAYNIETTATMSRHGFILHTPREEAAKFMPATTPSGMPKVALVVAKLIVNHTDRGARTFIVPICNNKEMCKGVSSTRLPPRSGTAPLDFSLTNFENVHLPFSALLGPLDHTTTDSRVSWWQEMSRIPIGTLGISAPWVQGIKHVAYIGGKYSLRRTILGKDKAPIPIINFTTQQWPVLQAVAMGMVLEAWFPKAVQQLQDRNVDPRIKHAVSVIYKTTVCRHFQVCASQMMERCGAQGTFEHNSMSRMDADGRGGVIAEGDVLTLCIRLFSELLLGRYAIPLPRNSNALLVRHATSILAENTRIAASLPGGHRGRSFNSIMLPQAELNVSSIGHALAYTAAVEAGVPQPLLDVYECAVMRLDPVWYSEKAGISGYDQRFKEHEALSKALPGLEVYLQDLDIHDYVEAPIIGDEEWQKWLATLPSFTGNAKSELFQGSTMARL